MRQEKVISQRIQDSFLYLCITDTEFLRAAYGSIKPEHFSSVITKDMIEICFTFFGNFNKAPEQHFHDELMHTISLKDEEIKSHYIQYAQKLQEMDPPNVAYVMEKVNDFVQAREFELAIVKASKFAASDRLDLARELMYKSLKTGIEKENVGKYLIDDGLPSYMDLGASNEPLIPLGFPHIDMRLKRKLCRTDFLCVFGAYKGKKSFSLIHFGILGLLAGLKVVHITHELSLEDTEMRYLQGLGCLSKHAEVSDNGITIEDFDNEGNVIRDEVIHPATIWDLERIDQIRKTAGRFNGQVLVKKYDQGSCTMNEIKRYLDYLETYEEFIPDIVINDYIEKMHIPSKNRNDEINDMYITSKGIADERKLLMITASQVTGAALNKLKLGKGDSAEDKRKQGNIDIGIGVGQVKDSENRMVAWVIANRHGPEGFGCNFATNLDIGQFCVKTWPIQSNRSYGSK